MRIRLLLLSLLFSACSGNNSPVHDPLIRPAAQSLDVTPCGIYGETQGGMACHFYDKNKHSFVDPATVDALTRRVYYYDRYYDLYSSPEGQSAERHLNTRMNPGDPESKWGDDQYLQNYDDIGDSGIWTATAGIAAAFRYATTGAAPDRDRLVRSVKASLSQFAATSIDGYLARFHYVKVPQGTPIKNGIAMDTGDGLPMPQSVLSQFPDYYTNGLKDAQGNTIPVEPRWLWNPSIDQYSGPMELFPLAASLLDDSDLKAQMAKQYSCFLKRLRIFQIINLSKNPQLQADLAHYLSTGLLMQDSDEPDLTKIDQVWGFYLPQFNPTNANKYDKTCPATLATAPSPDEVIDVSQPGYIASLLTLIGRQMGHDTPLADAIDFAYFPSVRGGDAAMLLSYSLGAYYLTGDSSFIDWRNNVLIKQANAQAIARTVAALQLPKICTTYYRNPNVYTSTFVGYLLDGDPASRAETEHLITAKLHDKLIGPLQDTLFEVLYDGALKTTTPFLQPGLAALLDYGGAPGFVDDPRRNYDVDNAAMPPPGITVAPPPAADVMLCDMGATVLGITIPGAMVDATMMLADKPLPLSRRVIGGFAWEHGPFAAVRHSGAGEGTQHYPGVDLSEPYWIARYYGLLPDPGVVLALDPGQK